MRIWAAGALGIFLGLALGRLTGGLWPAERPPGEIPATGPAAIAIEQEQRESAALRARVIRLEEALEVAQSGTSPVRESVEIEIDEAMPPEAPAEAPASAEQKPWFNEAKLLALGLHPLEIGRLRRAWEAWELEKLYVLDQYARSDQRDLRHHRRILELERELIEDMGDEGYDAILYASGTPNRVRIRSVLPDSEAETAGLEPGDDIMRYDDERIYRIQTVKRQTVACELGRDVAVWVIREGVEQRIWVPCGPLGVRLERASGPPL